MTFMLLWTVYCITVHNTCMLILKEKLLFSGNAEAPLTSYELKRMDHCLQNNVYMRQLGLPVVSNLFTNVGISLEKQKDKNQEGSASEYNGQDEDDNDGHSSDASLEPEAQDLQELEDILASLADKVLVMP